MNKLWILLASSSAASIYSVSERDRHFNLVKALSHAESRLKNSDLISDRPGHYAKNSKTLRGSFAEPTDHKTLEAERFATEISNELEKGRNSHAFIGLIVIAEPHFYGLFHKQCPQQLKNKIKFHHPKDYTHYTQDKLKAHLGTILEREIAGMLVS